METTREAAATAPVGPLVPATVGSGRLAGIRSRPTRLRRLRNTIRTHPMIGIGGGALLLLIVASLLAPWLATHDPLATATRERLQGPSLDHWFGTDDLGRDLFSRVLYGGQLSLRAGFIAVAIAVVGGTVVGLAAGYYGRWVDMILMRLADILMAMPGILLTMIFIFSLGPSLTNAMISIGLASIPEYARTVRGSVLSARENPYVDAARVIGAKNSTIMFRHILPNVIAPVLVVATVGIGGAILSLAGLSFLGLGAQPPEPEWGVIVSDGRSRLQSAWWITTFPGLAIAVAVLAINLFGDGLRDALDPRLRNR